MRLAGLTLLVVAWAPACGDPTRANRDASPRASAMGATRAWHSMTVLPSGLVLVAGGFQKARDRPYTTLASAELYDPATGSWTPTGPMTTARYGHAAVLLASGTVLIAGGEQIDDAGRTALDSAELYDPATGMFTPTASMATPRAGAAVLLPSGEVLALGGVREATIDLARIERSARAELYDAATATWRPAGSMSTPRYFHHSAVLLSTGEVLAIGGSAMRKIVTPYDVWATSDDRADLYAPAEGTWRASGLLTYPVAAASAAPLPGGDLLLAGGCINGDSTCSSDDVRVSIYDHVSGQWRNASPLWWGRSTATALPLPPAGIVIVGGTQYSNGGVLAERFDPASQSWSPFEALGHDHGGGAAAVSLPGGSILVAGGALNVPGGKSGMSEDRATIAVAEEFDPVAASDAR